MMPPATLAGYSEAELFEFYNEAAPDAREWRQLLEAEFERRAPAPASPAVPTAQWRERAEWYTAAHAQYLDADRICRGVLLSAAGRDRIGSELSLWSEPERFARRMASEELNRYWDAHGRLTFTAWQQGRQGERRQWQETRDRAKTSREETPVDTTHTTADTADTAARVAGAAVAGYGTSPAADLAARANAARARLAAGLAASHAERAGDNRAPELARPAGTAVAVRSTGAAARAEERAAEIIAESLRYAERVLTRHVSWPTPQALDTVLLWLLHANARDRDDTGTGPLIWRASPRLLVTSKERGSGKSTALDLVAILAGSRAGRLSRVTAPAFAKLMGKYQEAAILDEARMIFGSGQKSLDLQGMLLTGYTARAHSLTAHAGGTLEKLFGPVALGGKDNLITTASDGMQDLLDRCIIVRMRRASRHYPDIDDTAEQAAELAQRGMATWATMMRGQLLAAAAKLNREASEAGNLDAGDVEAGILRATQLWRPLIACADVAGGDWPDRARTAAAAGDAETDEWMADLQSLDTALWADETEPAYGDLYDEEG